MPFELNISLAINRACAVWKFINNACSEITNSKPRAMDVQALGTSASNTNTACKTPGKSLLRHINQQHVGGCCNLSVGLSNPNDLFGA